MATDTAFAIALIAVMGARVPVELRIFLTAAAIVDDIGAIVVVAVFYSGDIHPGYLAAAAAMVVALALLSRSRVYLLSPYILLGVALWAFVYAAASTLRWPACYLHCSFRRGRQPTWPP